MYLRVIFSAGWLRLFAGLGLAAEFVQPRGVTLNAIPHRIEKRVPAVQA
jgi:hypothetical protein